LTTATLATKEKCRSLNRKERQVEERTEGRKDSGPTQKSSFTLPKN
jgi:hypothetical protein